MSSDAPIVEVKRLVQGFAAWIFLATFWYDGEPFEYAYEVGTPLMSEESAAAVVKRQGLGERARKAFLSEVHMEMAH